MDAGGKPWRAWLPEVGGIGWTEVWTADFDANGRPDLLFASYFPGNGRCVDGLDVTVFLFDEQGRPVPSDLTTMLPDHSHFPAIPVIVRDLNKDHRAEFVLTDCNRIDPPEGFGERRSVSGIYEARDARIVPLRGIDAQPYIQIAKGIHGLPSMGGVPPADWHDPLMGFDDGRSIYLRSIPAQKSVKTERITFSDGTSLPFWPNVVIDDTEGREIYLTGNRKGLERLLALHYPLKKLGSNPEYPLLWAERR